MTQDNPNRDSPLGTIVEEDICYIFYIIDSEMIALTVIELDKDKLANYKAVLNKYNVNTESIKSKTNLTLDMLMTLVRCYEQDNALYLTRQHHFA